MNTVLPKSVKKGGCFDRKGGWGGYGPCGRGTWATWGVPTARTHWRSTCTDCHADMAPPLSDTVDRVPKEPASTERTASQGSTGGFMSTQVCTRKTPSFVYRESVTCGLCKCMISPGKQFLSLYVSFYPSLSLSRLYLLHVWC